MQLFSADATMFLKKKLNFFCPKKVEKLPSKVAQKNSNPLFSPFPQMAQTEEFMFQNVAYRPTVYRTGIQIVFFSRSIIELTLLKRHLMFCFVLSPLAG